MLHVHSGEKSVLRELLQGVFQGRRQRQRNTRRIQTWDAARSVLYASEGSHSTKLRSALAERSRYHSQEVCCTIHRNCLKKKNTLRIRGEILLMMCLPFWHRNPTADITTPPLTSQPDPWHHNPSYDITTRPMTSQPHHWHHNQTWHHNLTTDITTLPFSSLPSDSPSGDAPMDQMSEQWFCYLVGCCSAESLLSGPWSDTKEGCSKRAVLMRRW